MNLRPRVLIFSLAYYPFVGGAEVAVKEITKRLPEFEFKIISANVKSLWSKYWYPIWASDQAIREHAEKPYDLVWAIMANQAGMAAARFKNQFPEVPFLLTLQEGDDLSSWAYRWRLLGPQLFKVFERADYLQTISNYLADWARGQGTRAPIEVVPNGVDIKKFQTVGFVEHREEQKIIITTSRLVKKNGLDDLISALPFLPRTVRLKIFGSGPEEENLKRLAKQLGIWSRVDFMGEVSQERLPGQLLVADVFVRPSRSEGLGNSFLEAMAAGVPVVGTPVGGIPDFLQDGETGWFCRVDDPRSIAEKVTFILDSRNQAIVKKVITNAQLLVREKYNWDKIATQFNLIFKRLIRF